MTNNQYQQYIIEIFLALKTFDRHDKTTLAAAYLLSDGLSGGTSRNGVQHFWGQVCDDPDAARKLCLMKADLILQEGRLGLIN
jgi:hypothetical protein